MTPHFINLPFIMYMPRILSPTHSYLFQSCKSTLQILDDIVNMLGTNGQTDGVLLNALICQLLVSQLGVGCCCWMDNQALYVGNICKQREQREMVNKCVSFFFSSLANPFKPSWTFLSILIHGNKPVFLKNHSTICRQAP